MSISKSLSQHNARLQQFAQNFNITLSETSHKEDLLESSETHSTERYQAILQKYSGLPSQNETRIVEPDTTLKPKEIRNEEEAQIEDNLQEILKKYSYNPENEQTIKRSTVLRHHSPPQRDERSPVIKPRREQPSPLLKPKREEPIAVMESHKVQFLSPTPQKVAERRVVIEDRATPSPLLDEEDERVSFTLSQSSVGGFRMSIGHDEGIQTTRGEQETKMLLTPIKESHKEEEIKVEEKREEPVKLKTPKKMKSQQKQPPPPKYEVMWDALQEEHTIKLDYPALQQALQAAAQMKGPKDEYISNEALSPIPDASLSLDLSDDKEEEDAMGVLLESQRLLPQEQKIEAVPSIISPPRTPPKKQIRQKQIIQPKPSQFKSPREKTQTRSELNERKKVTQRGEEPLFQEKLHSTVKVESREKQLGVQIERAPEKRAEKEKEEPLEERGLNLKDIQVKENVELLIRMSGRRLASGRHEVRVWAQ